MEARSTPISTAGRRRFIGETHIDNLFAKIGVRTRPEAIRHGLASP